MSEKARIKAYIRQTRRKLQLPELPKQQIEELAAQRSRYLRLRATATEKATSSAE
jgi:hypothetical protein